MSKDLPIHKILKDYRGLLHKSQTEMATELETTRFILSYWELGEMIIPEEIQKKIKINYMKYSTERHAWMRTDENISLFRNSSQIAEQDVNQVANQIAEQVAEPVKPSGAMVYTVEKGANSLPVNEFQEALDALEGRRR